MTIRTILVVAETTGDELRPATLETITAANSLAAGAGARVIAGIAGSKPQSAAAVLASTGVSKVLVVDDPSLSTFTTDSAVAAAETFIGAAQPDLVMIPATTSGRDYAPRLAARLKAVTATDVVAISVDGDSVSAVRPVYGGKLLSRVALPESALRIVTIRPGSFEKGELRSESAPIEPVSFTPPPSRVRVEGLVDEAIAGSARLAEAEVVVGGGRGLKEQQNFALIEQLAGALGGVVGATRAVTDLGWRPHNEQVGQTGHSISPKLYVAVGISGAAQHVVGIQGSEFIVAINRDPDAPIFKLASFGIVGDLFEVVPAIVDELAASA